MKCTFMDPFPFQNIIIRNWDTSQANYTISSYSQFPLSKPISQAIHSSPIQNNLQPSTLIKSTIVISFPRFLTVTRQIKNPTNKTCQYRARQILKVIFLSPTRKQCYFWDLTQGAVKILYQLLCQRETSSGVLLKTCFEKLRKIHLKTPVPETLLNLFLLCEMWMHIKESNVC